MLIWPYWPFSKSLTMEKGFLKTGMRKYDLSEITRFHVKKATYKPGTDQNFMAFHYGRKTIELKVRNSYAHAFEIAQFLNWAHQGLVARGTLVQDEPGHAPAAAPAEDTRAAAF